MSYPSPSEPPARSEEELTRITAEVIGRLNIAETQVNDSASCIALGSKMARDALLTPQGSIERVTLVMQLIMATHQYIEFHRYDLRTYANGLITELNFGTQRSATAQP